MRKLCSVLLAAAGIMMAAAQDGRADTVIATVGPMTGSDAAFGAQMRAGFEQAVADLNAAGGVLGQKLGGEVGDDACDAKQAVGRRHQKAGKRVKVIGRAFLFRLVDPGVGCLLRREDHPDFAGLNQPETDGAGEEQRLPDLRSRRSARRCCG